MSKRVQGRTRYWPSSRLSPEDAMQIWRAREAYRAQGCWRSLCVLFFGLCLLVAVLHHLWRLAFQIIVGWWIVQWGFPRLLRMVIWGVEDGVQWIGRQAWEVGREQWHNIKPPTGGDYEHGATQQCASRAPAAAESWGMYGGSHVVVENPGDCVRPRQSCMSGLPGA